MNTVLVEFNKYPQGQDNLLTQDGQLGIPARAIGLTRLWVFTGSYEPMTHGLLVFKKPGLGTSAWTIAYQKFGILRKDHENKA